MPAEPESLLKKLRQLPPGGVVAVCCGFLLHLSLGSMYTFGNLTTYLTSYLHVAQGLDVDYGQTYWIGTLLPLFQGPFVLLGTLMHAKVGTFFTMLSGCLLLTLTTAATYLTVKVSLLWVAVTYGALNGAGSGLVYGVPLLVGHKWFPKHRGLVSGVVVGGYGLSGVILTTLQTSFINPDNIATEDDGFFHDSELLSRVPRLFLLQAGVCAALQLLGIFGIRDPPEERESRPQANRPQYEPANTEHESESASSSETTVQNSSASAESTQHWINAFKTITAWQLLIAYTLNSMTSMNVNNFWKSFGQTFIKDDHFLELVGAVSSVFNLMGRVFWGLLCDRFSYKPVMVVLTGLLAGLMFSWEASAAGGKAMYLLWVWSLMFTFSGTFCVVLTGTAEMFGQKLTGPVYGVIFMSAGLLAPVASIFSIFLFDNHRYSLLFLVLGFTTSLGMVVTMTLRK